jgi:beta-phosphoglucomutase-like phosphatase (HAD superfamily)
MTTLRLATAVVVSDRPNFLAAAADLGCRTILVANGSVESLTNVTHSTQVHDLAGAVDIVLGAPSVSIAVESPELQAIS